MSENAEIIIDVDVDTKKVDDKLQSLLDKIADKKIELDLNLRNQANIKKQLVELHTLMNKPKTNTPEMHEQFDKLSVSLKNTVSNVFILREQLKALSSEYRNLFKEQSKIEAFNFTFGKFLPSKQIAGLLPEKATKMSVDIIPNTEKLEDKLKFETGKLTQLVDVYKQLNASIQLKGPSANLINAFDNLKNRIEESKDKVTELKSGISSLSNKEANSINKLQTYFSRLGDAIRNSFSSGFSGFVSKISNISSTVSNTFGRIIGSFKNFNAHVSNSSRHLDYFSRRIFNLLRNAFVFNVISRQFRGLSALLGNLVHRDIYFVKSLMIVKANLVRAFAPIWQIILPWIRALGDGLVWISNQLIKFINFLTGSKIKPLQGFQEAKQVVDDFKRIASPTRDLFDLKDPNKYAKELRDNIKRSQQPSSKISKNANRLAKNLKNSQKQSIELLASFDKLEVLKFDKIKDPLGISELSDTKNLGNNNGIDIPINVPSVEEQIADAINNIEDKPLDFYVNDDIGEQIISQVNGLTLPALDFKVSEESVNELNNFKEKMMKFWNWISPLVESIGNFLKSLGESFKRLFDDLDNNGTFQMIIGWFDDWKNKLTDFFNTISQNKEQMDNIRNFIIGIGVAFITYQIISKISSLVSGISNIASLLTTSPLGWLVLAAGVFTTLSLNAGTFKEDLENIKNGISEVMKFLGKLSKKVIEAMSDIANSEFVKSVKKGLEDVGDIFGGVFKDVVDDDTLNLLANGIIAIGSALTTALIAKKVIDIMNSVKDLFNIISKAFDLTNPVGWVSLAVAALVLIVRHWDKIKGAIEIVWDKMKDFGNWIKDKFSGLWNWLKEKFIDPIANTFGKIGSWFGTTFGGNSGYYSGGDLKSIPGLAQGSVLKGGDPFLAYLNDQPRGQTNIEAPLSTIVDAFKQALSESDYNRQPDININASGDMSGFIRMLNFKLQDNKKILGNAFIDDIDF